MRKTLFGLQILILNVAGLQIPPSGITNPAERLFGKKFFTTTCYLSLITYHLLFNISNR